MRTFTLPSPQVVLLLSSTQTLCRHLLWLLVQLSWQLLVCRSTHSEGKCKLVLIKQQVFTHKWKLSLPAFNEIGGFSNLERVYSLAVPSKIIPNSTCHLPRPDAMHLFRDAVTGDLPWPGMTLGVTILATWYWCTDQVCQKFTLKHTVIFPGRSSVRFLHLYSGVLNLCHLAFILNCWCSPLSQLEMPQSCYTLLLIYVYCNFIGEVYRDFLWSNLI